MKTGWIAFLLMFAFLTGFDFSMAAESGYPTKSVEIISGQPGGGIDIGARMIAERAKEYLGQPVIVVSKPGGAGRVALNYVAKAKPDGYTLVALSDPAIVLIPHLEKVEYKPFDDFTFIVQYGLMDVGVAVSADSPFQNMKDLVEFARANPEKLTISVFGATSAGAVALSAIALREGVKIKIVPFSGGAAAGSALLGGHVLVTANALPVLSPHVKAKKVKMLAIMGEERDSTHPDVPTLKEVGYPIVFQNWYFIAGPKNLENSVAKKLEQSFRKVIELPEYTKFAKDQMLWARNPVSGMDLREGLIKRSRETEELLNRLGLLVK